MNGTQVTIFSWKKAFSQPKLFIGGHLSTPPCALLADGRVVTRQQSRWQSVDTQKGVCLGSGHAEKAEDGSAQPGAPTLGPHRSRAEAERKDT